MQAFQQFIQIAEESGFDPGLDYLEQVIRQQKNYPALFEVLKMKARRRAGLSVLYEQNPDQLDPAQQRDLEDGLLAACREIGTLLVNAGQLQQGWMYLQPVGDQELNQKLIRAVEVNDDNIEEVIEVAVSQGAAPAYGYGLLLKYYGTCNGITTFDTQANLFDRNTQQAMATVLVDHLYRELMDNLHYAMQQSEQELETQGSLLELLERYPQLTANGAHHIDTTHLASVMRIARIVDNAETMELAYQLAVYGSRLDPDFQYAGQPPFEDTYADHLHYYGPLTGREVDAGLAHFRGKLETVDAQQYGPVAIETLVELMYRVGRNDAAIDLMLDQLLGQHPPLGIAPDPLTIADTAELRERLMEHYRQQQDLVSFAACWVKGRE